MYIFKKELKEELLNGRSIKFIANKCEVTASYLSQVFNQKRGCSYRLAMMISNNEIDKYFTNIKIGTIN